MEAPRLGFLALKRSCASSPTNAVLCSHLSWLSISCISNASRTRDLDQGDWEQERGKRETKRERERENLATSEFTLAI